MIQINIKHYIQLFMMKYLRKQRKKEIRQQMHFFGLKGGSAFLEVFYWENES
jgi:hypothetical protein